MDDARKVYKGYGSTQSPTGADGTSSLSGMADDGNGDGVAPQQFAKRITVMIIGPSREGLPAFVAGRSSWFLFGNV
jgi:hypothetical protein